MDIILGSKVILYPPFENSTTRIAIVQIDRRIVLYLKRSAINHVTKSVSNEKKKTFSLKFKKLNSNLFLAI